jgi:protein-L-isoaspartate(D-aspartate) O-methyltransferase
MSGFAKARQNMVDGQVRPGDVTDNRILEAMLTVPREAFVPEDRQSLAYLDMDLDLAQGEAKRFLIKPAVTAKMLQAAEIGDTDKVLVAGTAPGYVSALAARLAAQVVATESDPAQVALSKRVLDQLGLHNVTFSAKAPDDGDPENAPYDVIILDGATKILPDRLYRQLREGGRLVGVFAMSEPPRATIITRSHGDFGHRALFDAWAPVLPGLERLSTFVF